MEVTRVTLVCFRYYGSLTSISLVSKNPLSTTYYFMEVRLPYIIER